MEDKNILLQKQIPSVLPMFRMDRRRLTQILSNILEAAIERTVHGDITISLQAKPNQHPDYQDLTIRFTDTGQGYSIEQQKVLVRSLQDIQYWLTLPDNERFGLSFMITNKIVQSMGGSLQIKSEEYEGTEYTLTIPMVEIE
jgi:signal transduction histidine kinase